MIAHRIASLVVVLGAVQTVELWAQSDSLPAAGERVRISQRPKSVEYGDPLIGSFVRFQQDTLVVRLFTPAGTVFVPMSGVEKLEVRRGQSSRATIGALLGFLVLGTAGGIAVQAFCTSYEVWPGERPRSSSECLPYAVGGFFLSGLVGACAGAYIGSRTRVDHWEEIPLEGVRLGPSPVSPDAVSVSVLIRV